jgi:predicted phosphodiesterase
MRTAIVSDLHLGSAFGEDLLRDAEIRRVLLDKLAPAERLVLLGDVVELRETPLATALESSRPFFEALGEAMAGRPVVLVPGNHDHRLAEPLLEQGALGGGALGLEQRAEPTGEATTRIASWLGNADVEIAYPGIWLRDDVYATHGHYMDCHMTLPRLECIAAAAAMRALGPLPAHPQPTDYERILRPVYGFTFGLAQGGLAGRSSRPSERAWRTMTTRNGEGSRARRAALRAALGAAVPAGIWGINRLLRSDFEVTLSSGSITRSGVAAASELARRLRIDVAHVITGHTHRGGPEEGDVTWPLPGGGRLHNTGSWVFASAFHHPGTPPGPYWPGTVTWLDDSGPPRRARLLLEHSREELGAAASKLATSIREP